MDAWIESALAPIVSTPDEAPAFWLNDCLWTVLASGDQTGGAYSLIEQLMPNHVGPPPHIHQRQIEGFYILEGSMKIQIGTETVDGTAGTFVSVPRGAPHCFIVTSETARVLNLYVPAALDTQVMLLGTPATHRTLPPEGAQNAPTAEQEQAFRDAIMAQATQDRTTVPNLVGGPGPGSAGPSGTDTPPTGSVS